MARFEGGWFRLNRRAVFEDIGQNPQCLSLWVWLLAMATLRESKIRWRGSQRPIPPGTVVTGYRELAKRTGIASTTVIRQLKYLERTERIRIESGAEGTLITICKWREYQLDHAEDGTQTEQEWDEAANGPEYADEHTAAYAAEYAGGTLLNKKQRTTNQKQVTKLDAPEPSLRRATVVGASETPNTPETLGHRAVIPSEIIVETRETPKTQDHGETPETRKTPHTAETWKAYSSAFLERWKVTPKWNATVGGQLAHFIRRVGKEDAPLVAEFYLHHNDRFYVKNMHPVGYLLKDAEKLYAEWKSGRQVTHLQATTVEKASNYASMLQRIDEGAL